MHFDEWVSSACGLTPHRRDITDAWYHAADVILVLLISAEVEPIELLLDSRHIPVVPLLILL